MRRIFIAAFFLLALSAAPAKAAIDPTQGTSCTGPAAGPISGSTDGKSVVSPASGNNLVCISGTWQYPAYQFGSTSASCNSTNAGTIQWTGSAIQYCNGTAWGGFASGGSAALSALTASTGTNTIDNAAYAQTWTWNTLTTGTALSLSSSGMTTGTILALTNTDTASNAGSVLSVSNSEGGASYAIHATSASTGAGTGVYGSETGSGNTGYGGYFSNTSTTGANYGVYGTTASTNNGAAAVYGANTGGSGGGEGVYGTTNSTGDATGVYGTNTGGSGNGSGVAGATNSTGTGVGVYGLDTGASNTGAGVYATNNSATGWGVYSSGTSPNYFAGNVGIGQTSPKAALHVNGGAIVGNDTASCASTNAGEVIWNGTAMEYCNGAAWTQFEPVQSTPVETAPSGSGYFVLSHGTYTGTLGSGSRAGADSVCLTDITTNTGWQGYSTANSNGQLVAAKVHAFICDSSACNNPMPLTTYYFANAANPAAGGAYFTTNSSGYGPGDSNAWSAANYFSGTYEYWTARTEGSSTLWGNVVTSDYRDCGEWTGSGSGDTGISTNTDNNRWEIDGGYGGSGGYESCSNSYHLICFVNP
jgi:hypothetical protein